MSMKIDSFGMIQSNGDGGDTCHRMFTMHLRMFLIAHLNIWNKEAEDLGNLMLEGGLAPIVKTLKTLGPANDGKYCRHPDPEFWGSDPRNCSRDQLVPAICYISLNNYLHSNEVGFQYAWRLLKACLKRGMFAQNIYPNWVDPRKETVKAKVPDFLNFELWGIFARGFLKTKWAPLALPFVIFGDFFLILAVLFKLWAPINVDGTLQFRLPDGDDCDDDNMNNCLMVSQYAFQTPFSWIARKLFKKFRQQNDGNKNGETNAIMGALLHYHGSDNKVLAELARPMVERY